MQSRADGLRELFSRIGERSAPPQRAHCANCGITIDDDDQAGGPPSSSADAASTYCCDGCAEGGPCTC